MPFGRKLYTICRIEDDVVLPNVHETHDKASEHLQALAPGFTYRIDTLKLPRGANRDKFIKDITEMLRRGYNTRTICGND